MQRRRRLLKANIRTTGDTEGDEGQWWKKVMDGRFDGYISTMEHLFDANSTMQNIYRTGGSIWNH
jgi:hypothetical protein